MEGRSWCAHWHFREKNELLFFVIELARACVRALSEHSSRCSGWSNWWPNHSKPPLMTLIFLLDFTSSTCKSPFFCCRLSPESLTPTAVLFILHLHPPVRPSAAPKDPSWEPGWRSSDWSWSGVSAPPHRGCLELKILDWPDWLGLSVECSRLLVSLYVIEGSISLSFSFL